MGHLILAAKQRDKLGPILRPRMNSDRNAPIISLLISIHLQPDRCLFSWLHTHTHTPGTLQASRRSDLRKVIPLGLMMLGTQQQDDTARAR